MKKLQRQAIMIGALVALFGFALGGTAQATALYWYGEASTYPFITDTGVLGTSQGVGGSTFTSGDTVYFGLPNNGVAANVIIAAYGFNGDQTVGDLVFQAGAASYPSVYNHSASVTAQNVTLSGQNWTANYYDVGHPANLTLSGDLTVNANSSFSQNVGAKGNSIIFNGGGSHNLNIASGLTLNNGFGLEVSPGNTLYLTGGGTYLANVGPFGGDLQAGSIVIQNGTFKLGYNNAFDSSAQLTMDGGTLALNGFNATLSTALNVSTDSFIDFAGGTSALAFGATTTSDWTAGNLTLDNFVVGSDTLRFGTDNTGLDQTLLSHISFIGEQPGEQAVLNNQGYVEFVLPVPEPTIIMLFGMGGFILFSLRHGFPRRSAS